MHNIFTQNNSHQAEIDKYENMSQRVTVILYNIIIFFYLFGTHHHR